MGVLRSGEGDRRVYSRYLSKGNSPSRASTVLVTYLTQAAPILSAQSFVWCFVLVWVGLGMKSKGLFIHVGKMFYQCLRILIEENGCLASMKTKV